MTETEKKASSARMLAVGKRLREWRARGGGRGSRIPDELWAEAASVARAEGVYATSRALRLEYGRLKTRCESQVVAVASTPAFVALELGDGRATSQSGHRVSEVGSVGSVAARRATIELTGRCGERMRIEMEGPGTLDLAGLAQTFWRCAS